MLREKLKPHLVEGFSPLMWGIAGALLQERITSPHIESLYCTSDNFVLAELEGDVGANQFIGALSELVANWGKLIEAANLTTEEEVEAKELLHKRLRHAPGGG